MSSSFLTITLEASEISDIYGALTEIEEQDILFVYEHV
jgi:hypothetical protein